jgi:hypothetical protein
VNTQYLEIYSFGWLLIAIYNTRFLLNQNKLLVMPVEVKEYVTGFISAIIAVVISISLIPTLMDAVSGISGIPLLTTALVGTVVGAGVLLFILKVFL